MKLLVLVLAPLVLTSPAAAAPQTLFLDAMATRGAAARESGVLRDADGRAVGHFAFACRTIAGTRRQCTEWGRTADGRIRVVGPVDTGEPTHHWRIASTTGTYRGGRGGVDARDLGDRESLITVTIAPRPGVVLRAGALRRPAANHAFRVRADALCAMAARRLAALPPFPFPGFDPLHPDPQLLPQVGRFFTGPHDPRPILRAPEASLQVLGQPHADRRGWAGVIAARAAALKVNDGQDRAVLTGDAGAFPRSVHDAQRTFRAVAIGATVFGVRRCVL